jgi:Ser/Thr protein kinase RdoA (MazF antagonist)
MPDPHSSKTLRASVEERLALVPEFADGAFRLVREFQTWQSGKSWILEYASSADPSLPNLLVKLRIGYKSSEAAAAMVQNEVNCLRTLHAMRSSLRARVPVLVAHIPEFNAVVLEKLPGRSFRDLLYQRSNALLGFALAATLLPTAARIGEWLADFQSATESSPSPFDPLQFQDESRALLELCVARGMDAELARTLSLHLDDAAVRLGGLSLRMSAMHGDFTPVNILVDRSQVSVFDLEDYRTRRPIYEDAGTMVAYLAISAESPLYHRNAMRRISAGFVKGLGSNCDRALLGLYAAKAGLYFTAVQLRATGTNPWWRFKQRSRTRAVAQLVQASLAEERRL